MRWVLKGASRKQENQYIYAMFLFLAFDRIDNEAMYISTLIRCNKCACNSHTNGKLPPLVASNCWTRTASMYACTMHQATLESESPHPSPRIEVFMPGDACARRLFLFFPAREEDLPYECRKNWLCISFKVELITTVDCFAHLGKHMRSLFGRRVPRVRGSSWTKKVGR